MFGNILPFKSEGTSRKLSANRGNVQYTDGQEQKASEVALEASDF